MGTMTLKRTEKTMSKSNRGDALEWWRNLSKKQKIKLAQEYFEDMDFILITTSSNRINRIYNQEHKA